MTPCSDFVLCLNYAIIIMCNGYVYKIQSQILALIYHYYHYTETWKCTIFVCMS